MPVGSPSPTWGGPLFLMGRAFAFDGPGLLFLMGRACVVDGLGLHVWKADRARNDEEIEARMKKRPRPE